MKHRSALLVSSQVKCLYVTFVSYLSLKPDPIPCLSRASLRTSSICLCYFLPISSRRSGTFVLIPVAILSPCFAEAVVRRKTLSKLNLGDL